MATATHNLISASRSVRAGMLAVCGTRHQEPMAETGASWRGLNSENSSSRRLQFTGSSLSYSGVHCGDCRHENGLKANPVKAGKVTGLMQDDIQGKIKFANVIKAAA